MTFNLFAPLIKNITNSIQSSASKLITKFYSVSVNISSNTNINLHGGVWYYITNTVDIDATLPNNNESGDDVGVEKINTNSDTHTITVKTSGSDVIETYLLGMQ